MSDSIDTTQTDHATQADPAPAPEGKHALHRNLFGRYTNGRVPAKAILARHGHSRTTSPKEHRAEDDTDTNTDQATE